MYRHSGRLVAWSALLAALPSSLAAQTDTTSIACTGQIVSRVDVTAEPPPFGGYAKKWQAAAHTIGLHHATTRAGVVRAFLSLGPGKECTERRRTESERVLRAQPFLSTASVRAVADTGGTVAIVIRTTDEVPVLVSGRFRGITPESFSLGNENLFGEALRVQGHIERGGAYRTIIGGHIEQNALFGHPYRFILDGDRYLIGRRENVEIEHPFFTDLQRISWHGGFVESSNYVPFERPARDGLILQADDHAWDASALLRIFGTSTVGLLGGAITGRRFDPAAIGQVVTDSGLRTDTGTALNGRYKQFRAGRIGGLAGIRRVNFQTVTGFDALVGAQDVARGAMAGVYVARGLSTFGDADTFISGAGYAGAASGNALIATLGQLEGRRDPSGAWNAVVGSMRTAFYLGTAPGIVLAVDDELSGGRNSVLPLQLSFREVDGGLISYRNSALAGAVRNISHAEIRWSGASVVRRADLGIATFVESGTLWAGDAPYGVNATRTTVGISLLGAYPSRAKRLYRVDVGIPLTRSGTGGGKVEVRFSSQDRTQSFFVEPSDVARARTGTSPSRLFAWPTR